MDQKFPDVSRFSAVAVTMSLARQSENANRQLRFQKFRLLMKIRRL